MHHLYRTCPFLGARCVSASLLLWLSYWTLA